MHIAHPAVVLCFVVGCEAGGSEPAGAAPSAATAKEAREPRRDGGAGRRCSPGGVHRGGREARELPAGSGEADKKLWTNACDQMRACIIVSKTKEERDACAKNKKAF